MHAACGRAAAASAATARGNAAAAAAMASAAVAAAAASVSPPTTISSSSSLCCQRRRLPQHHHQHHRSYSTLTPCAAAAAANADSSGSTRPASKQPPRFYAPSLPPSAGAGVELEPDEAKHAVRVLRLQPGDAVELCDGRGSVVPCEVASTTKASAMLVTTAEPLFVPWRGPQWVVAAACLTLKGGRTDWLVEKATELGAHSLLPLLTARAATGSTRDKFRALASGAKRQRQQQQQQGLTAAAAEVHGGSGEEYQAPRLERLALAATKQSLRTHALQLQPPTQLDALLPRLQQAPLALVAAAGAPPLLRVLQEQPDKQQQQRQQDVMTGATRPAAAWCGQPCYLLIGPEGDFTSEEVASLAAAGVLPVGLGPTRLRTETAAIAALSAAMLFSDSQQS